MSLASSFSPLLRKLLFPALLISTALLSGCGGETVPETSSISSGQTQTPKSRKAATSLADGSSASPAGRQTPAPIERPGPSSVKVSVLPEHTIAPQDPDAAYPVPKGREAILKFLEKLASQLPQGQTNDEKRQDLVDIQEARIHGAERLLQDPESSADLRMTAAQAQTNAARLLVQSFPKEAEKFLQTICQKLAQDKDPKIANFAQIEWFDMGTDNLLKLQVNDISGHLKDLKKHCASEHHHPAAYSIFSRAALAMHRLKHPQEAQEAYRAVAAAFIDHQDPQIALAAKGLSERARCLELRLEEKVSDLLLGKQNAWAKVQPILQTLIDDNEQPANGLLDVALHQAQLMELGGYYEEARQTYQMLQKKYQGHPQQQLAESAAQLTGEGISRISLVGQPIELEGVRHDGKPFDWSGYQNKVVLIAFWATWSQDSLIEFGPIAQSYQRHREQGFEVVSVCIDEEDEKLKEFLNWQKPPGEIVLTADKKQRNIKHPLLVKAGVREIPFLLLVNREGRVDSLHVRGPRLEKRLAALLNADAAKQSRRQAQPMETFFVSFDDEPQEPKKEEEEEKKEEPEIDSSINPYAPPEGLSTLELADFIFDMLDKPKSIRRRDGFAEGIVLAADAMLKKNPSERYQVIAIQAKLEQLHDQASWGDEKADAALWKFVQEIQDHKNAKIAADVRFFQMERKLIDADEKTPAEKIPALLKELEEYLQAEKKLTARHLRLASHTVRQINRIEDGEAREKEFQKFGGMFAKSSDRELAGYGKKIAKSPAAKGGDLVGKELELVGVTDLGAAFDWKQYRGKVVLIDFWATWCGPCRREAPHLKALYESLKEKGFDVVAISLDKDQDALAKYLDENKIPWTNLVGESAAEIAKKYNVSAIPTMMLVDQKGKVVAVSHKVAELKEQAEKLVGR